ncbi:hypothetical protein NOF04DRAFT_17118 [Fusarium oxysporum II5]|uniref:Secreted protein n=2 Tax=Fusarium oxysporum species complex TaxID=171631 RepID=X0JWF4_FUSO5|nr:uncharacterized protein FOIG_04163 [Fusarium odoratissimum NRRL 54006]EXM05634.1 hypothetical protein FOIG_04163 [Fusarium odoratissimum NRRL 54006]KAK2126059.1 hypothetical protein NOF04DRAFT_17118 [Fusarium oxysporum II5]TXB99805.1 hypothetical protein FocTR4_00014272 [Fusarium oxysporum f. sp. cubense]
MVILPLALYLRYSMLAGTGKCCVLGTLYVSETGRARDRLSDWRTESRSNLTGKLSLRKDEGYVGRQHKMKESDQEI